jgi:hypothetical protein
MNFYLKNGPDETVWEPVMRQILILTSVRIVMGPRSLAAVPNNFLSQSLLRLVRAQRLVDCTLISPFLFFLLFLIYVFCFMTFCACARATWRPAIFGHRCALLVPFVQFIGTFHFDLGFRRRHLGIFLLLLDSFDIV